MRVFQPRRVRTARLCAARLSQWFLLLYCVFAVFIASVVVVVTIVIITTTTNDIDIVTWYSWRCSATNSSRCRATCDPSHAHSDVNEQG